MVAIRSLAHGEYWGEAASSYDFTAVIRNISEGLKMAVKRLPQDLTDTAKGNMTAVIEEIQYFLDKGWPALHEKAKTGTMNYPQCMEELRKMQNLASTWKTKKGS